MSDLSDEDVRTLLARAVPEGLAGVRFGAVAERAAARHRRATRDRVLGALVAVAAGGVLTVAALPSAPPGDRATDGSGGPAQATAGDAADVLFRLASLVPLGIVLAVTVVAVLVGGFGGPRVLVRRERSAADRAPSAGTGSPLALLLGLGGATTLGAAVSVLAATAGRFGQPRAPLPMTTLTAVGCLGAVVAVSGLILADRRAARQGAVARLAVTVTLLASGPVVTLAAVRVAAALLGRALGHPGAVDWTWGRTYAVVAAAGTVALLTAAVAASRLSSPGPCGPWRTVRATFWLVTHLLIAQVLGYLLTVLVESIASGRPDAPEDLSLAFGAAVLLVSGSAWTLLRAGTAVQALGVAPAPQRPATDGERLPWGASTALQILWCTPSVLLLWACVCLGNLVVTVLVEGLATASMVPLPGTLVTPRRLWVALVAVALLAWSCAWAADRLRSASRSTH